MKSMFEFSYRRTTAELLLNRSGAREQCFRQCQKQQYVISSYELLKKMFVCEKANIFRCGYWLPQTHLLVLRCLKTEINQIWMSPAIQTNIPVGCCVPSPRLPLFVRFRCGLAVAHIFGSLTHTIFFGARLFELLPTWKLWKSAVILHRMSFGNDFIVGRHHREQHSNHRRIPFTLHWTDAFEKYVRCVVRWCSALQWWAWRRSSENINSNKIQSFRKMVMLWLAFTQS